MIKPKIELTDNIRAFILDERKKTGQPAEFVSENIGRAKSWLSQIENGRLKNINRVDFINLMSYLLKTTKDEAEEYIEDFLNRNELINVSNDKKLNSIISSLENAVRTAYSNLSDDENDKLLNSLLNLHEILVTNPHIAIRFFSLPFSTIFELSDEQATINLLQDLADVYKKHISKIIDKNISLDSQDEDIKKD